jgi:hypothetical protein
MWEWFITGFVAGVVLSLLLLRIVLSEIIYIFVRKNTDKIIAKALEINDDMETVYAKEDDID